jgi:diguanylate cyclase (GGDEF)-like protein
VTQDQWLLASVGALVTANVLLVASILVRARRRPDAIDELGSWPPSPTGAPGDDRQAAAVEAFVERVEPDAVALHLRSTPPTLVDETAAAPFTRTNSTAARVGGLADLASWSRAIREESARAARYGRPATVVMAELPGLHALANGFGQSIADRVAGEAARLLTAEGREADRIARLSDERFGILLSETDERAADRYVERVRAAVDGWLSSAGLSMRLSLGWASPPDGGDVAAAVTTAEQRMHEATRTST